MKADISIRRISNAYIVKTHGWDGPDHYTTSIPDDDPISVLWQVIDALGLAGSRYDAQRIYVGMKPGDKHHDLHPTPCKDCACGCDPDQSTGPLDG